MLLSMLLYVCYIHVFMSLAASTSVVYCHGCCFLLIFQALRDYGIVLLLPSKKEIDLKVLINRALLYVELSDHHNALQVVSCS